MLTPAGEAETQWGPLVGLVSSLGIAGSTTSWRCSSPMTDWYQAFDAKVKTYWSGASSARRASIRPRSAYAMKKYARATTMAIGTMISPRPVLEPTPQD